MNDDGKMLSQEEIDALMNKKINADSEYTGNPDEILSDEQKDVLGEIGNIAMGSAATALYTMLDQKVEITTPQVNVSRFEEITEEYDRPCVLVKVEYIAGLEGANLLIIKEEDATIIADLMMGGDGTNVDNSLDEIRLSAVGEAMNQMMGSASTSLSSIINDMVNISPPESLHYRLDEAIELDDIYFKADDLVVDTAFQLKIGDLIDSSFKQLAPLNFTKKLVEKLTSTNSGGLTVKDEIPEEEMDNYDNEETAKRETSVSAEERAPETERKVVSQSSEQRTYDKSEVNFDSVGVQRAHFPDFDNRSAAPLPQNMELIHDVPLQVTVRLGESKMTIKDILDLGEGSIVELDKLAGEAVDLLVNGKLVAKGEVVVIDENFGFRVKDIISPMERLNNI